MGFAVGQRVIVIQPEFDFDIIDAGAEIPVGSVGIVTGVSHTTCYYDPTKENYPIYTVFFEDISFKENGYWVEKDGSSVAELFEPMIALINDDESWTDGVLESDMKELFP